MELSISSYSKLPNINRARVSIFFATFVSVIFLIYAISQLIYAKFNLTLIFSSILLNDSLILLSIIICTVIIFYNLYTPPLKQLVRLTEYNLFVGKWKYEYTSITAFSLIDLGDYFEISIKTNDFRTPFVYFYVQQTNPNFNRFISLLSELIPYQDSLEEQDMFHKFLRTMGLK